MRQKFLLAVAILGATALMAPVVSAQTVADIDPVGLQARCIVLQSKNLRYQARDSATGGEVSSLQDFLQSKGYLNSEPTGYMGLMTVSAIKSFQRANGIDATGFAGPYTRSKIKELSCKGAVLTSGPTTGPTTPTSVSIPGCVSGAVYNYLTGKRCDSVPTLVPGCASGAVYNYLTGARCDTTSTPTPILSRITLLSPNGGETYTVGSKVPIRFRSSVVESQATGVTIKLWRGTSTFSDAVFVQNVAAFGKLQMDTYYWTIPSNMTPGSYMMQIVVEGMEASYPKGVDDFSNLYFNIVSATTPCVNGSGPLMPDQSYCFPTKPLITVISPNGGGYWYTGSTTEITWKTVDIPTSNQMLIRMRNYDTGVEYNLTTSVNDGYEKIVLPSHIPAHAYTIEIKTSVNGQSYMDASDSYFKVPSDPLAQPTITVDKSSIASDTYVQFNFGKYPSNAAAWLFKVECPIGVTASMKATDCGQVVRFTNPSPTVMWDAWLNNSTSYSQTVTAMFDAVDAYDRVIGSARTHVTVAPKAINYDACRLDKLDDSNITRNAYTVQSDCLSKICDIYGPANLRSGTPSKCVFNGTEIKRYQSTFITQPSISVVSPNGGEVYSFDSTLNIQWKSTGGSIVYLYLAKANESGECRLGSANASAGSFSVNIRNMDCSFLNQNTLRYRIFAVLDKTMPLADSDTGTARDYSDNSFAINPPCLTGAGPLLPGQRYCGSN